MSCVNALCSASALLQREARQFAQRKRASRAADAKRLWRALRMKRKCGVSQPSAAPASTHGSHLANNDTHLYNAARARTWQMSITIQDFADNAALVEALRATAAEHGIYERALAMGGTARRVACDPQLYSNEWSEAPVDETPVTAGRLAGEVFTTTAGVFYLIATVECFWSRVWPQLKWHDFDEQHQSDWFDVPVQSALRGAFDEERVLWQHTWRLLEAALSQTPIEGDARCSVLVPLAERRAAVLSYAAGAVLSWSIPPAAVREQLRNHVVRFDCVLLAFAASHGTDEDAVIEMLVEGGVRCAVRDRFVVRAHAESETPSQSTVPALMANVCPTAARDGDGRYMRVWLATDFALVQPTAKASVIELLVRGWLKSGARWSGVQHLYTAMVHACGKTTIGTAP